MKEKINNILFPLNVLMAAFGFLNFGKDLLPGLINWGKFILSALDFFKIIRNFFLYPLSYLISIFNLEMTEWFKTYLFLGLLTFNTYNYSYRKICGHSSNTSLLRIIIGPQRFKILLFIFYHFLFWPLHIFELIEHYCKKGYEKKENVLTLWGKYIFWYSLR